MLAGICLLVVVIYINLIFTFFKAIMVAINVGCAIVWGDILVGYLNVLFDDNVFVVHADFQIIDARNKFQAHSADSSLAKC